MKFEILQRDQRARRGRLELSRGTIETPIFMPIGTRASVKTLETRDLLEMQAQIILANTYHLYLRPGDTFLKELGGLHQFMNWDRPILTDSGGYQVFSLSELRKITEEGVHFRSHIDGSRHLFTPESNVQVQRNIGADIVMALDECPPYPVEKEYARQSLERTTRWADRYLDAFHNSQELYGHEQTPFAIVQGSVFDDLRIQSARELVALGFPAYAIGGLSVGEPKNDMYRITALLDQELPEEKPRYLMGVGTPLDLLESVARGVDMFDCVLPTRNGRNGTVFTHAGRLIIKSARFARDRNPIDEHCNCYTCRTYDRAYIRHLFQVGEISAMRLATIHNLTFYLDLMDEVRTAISENRFQQLLENYRNQWQDNDEKR